MESSLNQRQKMQTAPRCESLYANGLKKLEEKQKFAEQLQRQKEIQELASATFHPHINSNRNLEEYFAEYQKSLTEKLKQKKEQLEAEERKKFQFKPTTNRISNEIALHKSRTQHFGPVDRFQELYLDAKKAKEKLGKDQTVQFPFRPTLTCYNPKLYQNSHSGKKEKEKQSEEECTFTPKINPGSKAERKGKKSVCEYLYNTSKTVKEKLDKKREEETQKLKEKANRRFTQSKSQILLEKRKTEQILEIFKALDGDSDGVIDSGSIDIEKFSIQLLDIFTPIFKELEENNSKLTQEEFLYAILKLYDTLPVPDKKAILEFGKKKPQQLEKQLSFKPTFNERSLRLAVKKRPPGEEITEIFAKEKRESDKKVAALKSERERQELRKCTFRPNIFTRAASYQETIRRHSVFPDEGEQEDFAVRENFSVQDERFVFEE